MDVGPYRFLVPTFRAVLRRLVRCPIPGGSLRTDQDWSRPVAAAPVRQGVPGVNEQDGDERVASFATLLWLTSGPEGSDVDAQASPTLPLQR